MKMSEFFLVRLMDNELFSFLQITSLQYNDFDLIYVMYTEICDKPRLGKF